MEPCRIAVVRGDASGSQVEGSIEAAPGQPCAQEMRLESLDDEVFRSRNPAGASAKTNDIVPVGNKAASKPRADEARSTGQQNAQVGLRRPLGELGPPPFDLAHREVARITRAFVVVAIPICGLS